MSYDDGHVARDTSFSGSFGPYIDSGLGPYECGRYGSTDMLAFLELSSQIAHYMRLAMATGQACVIYGTGEIAVVPKE